MRLIDGVNSNLPTFHRYLKLRKRMMGVSELHYYDLYAPLVASVDLTYTADEAEKHVLAALAPLGPDYAAGANARVLRSGGSTCCPNDGQACRARTRTAARTTCTRTCCSTTTASTRDVSTLAHELGHTMHSYFSNKTQPFATANYPIFVAEVASTFNEALLIEHMLKNDHRPERSKLSLLGNYLENIKGTVFRQTQFAEFELRDARDGGEGRAADRRIARRALRRDHRRSTTATTRASASWTTTSRTSGRSSRTSTATSTSIQYATSFTASAALSEKVLAGDPAATKRYLAFLRSGGSKYPIDLLKDAGVDMTTDEPLDLTMQKMNRVMDEMEKLLTQTTRQGSSGRATTWSAFNRPAHRLHCRA